jgi:hypothetical protein
MLYGSVLKVAASQGKLADAGSLQLSLNASTPPASTFP